MTYFTHNLHFLALACSMQGNSKCALENAAEMARHVSPGVKEMPMLEWFLAWQPLTLVRFQKWNDILALPQPDPSPTMDSGAWHYARGQAYLAQGNKEKTQAERKALAAIISKTPEDAPYGFNHAKTVLTIAADILDGKIATADGDWASAADRYRKAVALQDQLNYDEPPDWYYPVRETLGAALLMGGDAVAAEAVFRADLERNPRNGRSLYGLSKSLEAQKKTTEAAWVQTQFKAAWVQADVQPDLAEY
jgi:tetratricopeptide (TPR) repeat protein